MRAPAIIRELATHAGRLERHLGKEQCEQISGQMTNWYGPPIAVAGAPGHVFARKGGDFVGPIRGGYFASLFDLQMQKAKVLRKLGRLVDPDNLNHAFKRWARRQQSQVNSFASLSDLIAEATAGKRYDFAFAKAGTAGVVGATNSLWRVGSLPPAGAAAAAAPGGTVPTDATTGAFAFTNPSGGDTTHIVGGEITAATGGNALLAYDRLFAVAKTMNSTATEAVTGVPTRYQSTTQGDADYIGGNFLIFECGTALPATAHNWTVCTYTDQANAASTLPSLTGNSSNIANRLDHPVSSAWFAPLEAGDVGIKALTQMQLSASLASGAVDAVIGHPLCWLPCPVANLLFIMDGINTAFNLVRIFDDAAIALLEPTKPVTTATGYTGKITAVYG